MTVEFIWDGDKEGEQGKATYITEISTYELRLPNYEKGVQLKTVISEVFKEGRYKGHHEMMQDVTAAMIKVLRK